MENKKSHCRVRMEVFMRRFAMVLAIIVAGVGMSGRALVKKGDQLLFDGTFEIDPTNVPKTEDATQTSEGENNGKTTLSIYEIEGDTMPAVAPNLRSV
jgi:uncharacterized protein (TIGR03067 family)